MFWAKLMLPNLSTLVWSSPAMSHSKEQARPEGEQIKACSAVTDTCLVPDALLLFLITWI